MPAPTRWRLVDPAMRERVAQLCPLAPLPWGTDIDKPWCIVDADGNDIVISANPADTTRSIQTLGMIVSAINTASGYVTEKETTSG